MGFCEKKFVLAYQIRKDVSQNIMTTALEYAICIPLTTGGKVICLSFPMQFLQYRSETL